MEDLQQSSREEEEKGMVIEGEEDTEKLEWGDAEREKTEGR